MTRHMRKRKCTHCQPSCSGPPQRGPPPLLCSRHATDPQSGQSAALAAHTRPSRLLPRPASGTGRGPWRQRHPGSWRRTSAQASDAPEAFQDA